MTDSLIAIALSHREAQDRIVDELEKALTGHSIANQFASYDALAGSVNMENDREFKSLLRKARTRLTRSGVEFKTLTGLGLKPLNHVQSMKEIGTTSRLKVSRQVDRWGKRLKAIDPHRLAQADLSLFIQENLSHLKYEEVSSSTTQEKIEATVEAIESPLSHNNLKKMLLAAREELRNIG